MGTILVVDDEPAVCKVLLDYFTTRGHQVFVANNGQEALVLAERIAPQIIILDLYMPVMDGPSLARTLRARQYAGKIIVITGRLDENRLQEMLDLGAVDVMSKPFDFKRLEIAVSLACALAS